MVIDRISTAGLLMLCSQFYPDYSQYFIYLMMLDIGSHWLQTHSGLMGDNLNQINHKSLDENNFIVKLYYTNKYCLLVVCLFAELFLLGLYLNHFYQKEFQAQTVKIFMYFCFVIYAFKQYVSVLQAISASKRIANVDISEYHQRKKNK